MRLFDIVFLGYKWYNLCIVSKPKTWSCTQLASCSSLQWVLVPTMKKCINLYSKCPCQLINHFITRCQLHLVQVHRTKSRNPTNGPMGKVRAPFAQRWWGNRHRCQWIYQSWWNLRTHLQPRSVTWCCSLVKAFFLGVLWGGFFVWFQKIWVGINTQKKIGKNHLGLFVIGDFWKKFYWTKRFGFTNKNQEKRKRTTEAAMIWGEGAGRGLEKYIEFLTGLVLWLLFYLRKKLHREIQKIQDSWLKSLYGCTSFWMDLDQERESRSHDPKKSAIYWMDFASMETCCWQKEAKTFDGRNLWILLGWSMMEDGRWWSMMITEDNEEDENKRAEDQDKGRQTSRWRRTKKYQRISASTHQKSESWLTINDKISCIFFARNRLRLIDSIDCED